MVGPGIEITGANAEAVEHELQALFESELGERAQRIQQPPDVPRPRVRADPIAVAALFLSIPSALLATMDLAQRLKLKPKVERLVDWARQKRAADPQVELTLVLPDRPALALDRAEPSEVLEALAAAGAPGGRSGAS